MRTERAIRQNAKQQARIFVKFKQPPFLNREVMNADYTLTEIREMCADGWQIMSCQLQRTVAVDATEVTLTAEDVEALEDAAALQPEQQDAE